MPAKRSETAFDNLHRLAPSHMRGEVTWTQRSIEAVPQLEAPSRFADRLAVGLAALFVGGGAYLTWVLFVR